MSFTPSEIAIIAFCSFFVGLSKSGFAGSVGLLATPLLAATTNPRFALGILLPLLLASDILNFYHFWRQWSREALNMVLPGCFLGVLLGWPLLRLLGKEQGNEQAMRLVIGFVAITFACIQVFKEWKGATPEPFRPTRKHGLVAGAATGVVSTLAHQGGVVTQMYLLPQKLSAPAFVGTTTVIYFFTNLAKMPIFFKEELIDGDTLRWAAYNLPLIFVGTAIGTYLNRRMSGRAFNRVVLAFTLVTGLKLIYDSLIMVK